MKLCIPLLIAASFSWGQVKITQAPDRIRIEIDGKHFSDYMTGAELAKPYLHPLRSATGKQVSRSFPMDIVEGEKRDHPHHRGLWFSYGEVNGWDFWANEKSQKGEGKGRGEIKVVKVKDIKSGKKNGSVSTLQDWIDGSGKRIISEARTMTFYSDPAVRMIDFDIALTAVEDCTFGDTKEGAFAIRLARALEEEKTGKMVSAEGAEGEKKVWGTRSNWVDYAGELEGEKVGVAILDHPSNPRHPTYWHSRAYGLFAANMFGTKDFTKQKEKTETTLKAGGVWHYRFRVIIHPGDAKSFDLPAAWTKFSALK